MGRSDVVNGHTSGLDYFCLAILSLFQSSIWSVVIADHCCILPCSLFWPFGVCTTLMIPWVSEEGDFALLPKVGSFDHFCCP